MRGSSSWLPFPSVFAGKALIPASCVRSISSDLARGDNATGAAAAAFAGVVGVDGAGAALLLLHAASAPAPSAARAPSRRKRRRSVEVAVGTNESTVLGNEVSGMWDSSLRLS